MQRGSEVLEGGREVGKIPEKLFLGQWFSVGCDFFLPTPLGEKGYLAIPRDMFHSYNLG